MVYVADTNLRRELTTKLVAGEPGPLFVNRRGTAPRPHSVCTKLLVLGGQAGIKRRVTCIFATQGCDASHRNGVDKRVVQKLLGHLSFATTEIYTHVSDETLRTTFERANVLGTLAL
ncbi:tyrosine-type recombinase/integrase [Bradyrhizobium diazoefficiens]|nr:tyrosine-type recombinase/integrase [Bradyrhizobium diazoefficiens]